MRVQKVLDASQESNVLEEPSISIPVSDLVSDSNKKKRKASDEDEGTDTIRKRNKASNPSLPAGFFDAGQEQEEEDVTLKVTPTNEIQMKIPSRPATPLKATQEIPTLPSVPETNPNTNTDVDEDEWAAFEADIAATETAPGRTPISVNGGSEGVISAPAMTTEELRKKEAEEDNKRRRERAEAEAEGDKEDAARKLEEEFEEMEGLEQRVRRLREKREALRKGAAVAPDSTPASEVPMAKEEKMNDEEDDDDDEEEDDWDGFRMKG